MTSSDSQTSQERKSQKTTFPDIVSTKILNKILPNLIRQYIKRVIHHDQVKCKLGSVFYYELRLFTILTKINISLKKPHITLRVDEEKIFDKNSNPLLIKTLKYKGIYMKTYI